MKCNKILYLLLFFFMFSCGSQSEKKTVDELPPPDPGFIPIPPEDLGETPLGDVAGELLVKTIAHQSFRFRWIPPGSFEMGTDTDPNRFFTTVEGVQTSLEGPAHSVAISNGFWMLETEVTQDQWYYIMGENPSDVKGGSLPVVNIQYEDIAGEDGFLEKLHLQTIRTFKFFIPTEAQWEYACRAGTTTYNYWGDDPTGTEIDKYCWYTNNSGNTINMVGKKTANPWGLRDMSGNAYEIVEDFGSIYSSAAVTDPKGPSSGTTRIYRGGSFKSSRANCRSTNRIIGQQLKPYHNQGFRFIMIPD